MAKTTRIIALFLCLTFSTGVSSAFAADNGIQEIFIDAFYGGAVGVLVGGAAMVFTNKPSDHYNYLSYGAATGVIIGAIYGGVQATRSFATIEKGEVKFALPTLRPSITESSLGTPQITVMANIVSGKFN